MRIDTRLLRLEDAARRRAAPTECPECGGPVPGRSAYVVAGPDGRPRWGVCGRCGLALDGTGRAGPAWSWTPDTPDALKVYDWRTPIGLI